jgi:hypothetical protein
MLEPIATCLDQFFEGRHIDSAAPKKNVWITNPSALAALREAGLFEQFSQFVLQRNRALK